MDEIYNIQINQVNAIPWGCGKLSVVVNPAYAREYLYRYPTSNVPPGHCPFGITASFRTFGPNDWCELHFVDSTKVRIFMFEGVVDAEFIPLR